MRNSETEYHGDYEDPIKCGILRKSSLRNYRDRLKAERRVNVFHGLLIATSLTAILAMFMLHSSVPNEAEEKNPSEIIPELSFWTLLRSIGTYLLNGQRANTAREFYCKQNMDVSRLLTSIRQQVLNQDQALNKLERVMRRREQFKAVALLGPPGVGKSLTAMALRQSFPWPENVHSYSWSTYVPDEVRKFHLVRTFIEQLSNCGQNLLIIDNLTTCDYSFVPIFNSLIKDREAHHTVATNQNVLVVYIFNMESEHYWEQFELLQQLPRDTTIISYRPFGQDELADCLHNELKVENRYLTKDTFTNILNDVDVFETGCKNIHKAVLAHGQFEL